MDVDRSNALNLSVVLGMNLFAQSLRTAIMAAFALGNSLAGDLPLHGHATGTVSHFPALTVDLPNPWWREAIQIPLGIASRTTGITADEAVVQSLSQSPDVQVLNVLPQIQRTEITRQQAAFDGTNFLDTAWNDRSDPIGSTLTTGSAGGRYQDQLMSTAGGARKTTSSGAEISAAERFGWEQNNSAFLVPNPQSTSRLELTLTQPLLAGRGEAYNLRRVVEAKLVTEGSQANSVARVQEYLLSVHERYWELYRTRAIFIQRKRAADRASQLAESLVQRAKLDTTSRQLMRSRTAAAQQKAELMLAASAADMASIDLRRLLGVMDMESELIPMQSPAISIQPIDAAIAIQTALSKRAEIDAAVREIRIASVRLGASKNELMPRLNLIAGAYVAGLTPNTSFGNAFGQQFSEGRPTYNVGMAWERPAGNRAARSTQHRRQLELQKAMSQYESAVQDVRRDVEVALHQVHLTFRSLQQRHESLAASNAEANFLFDRWNTSPGNDGPVILLLEDLISAQSRLADEENATVIAETNHALAQVRYLKAVGTLIQSRCAVDTSAVLDALPVPAGEMIQSEVMDVPAPTGDQP